MIDWLVLAFASSIFAALTSIFAKIGIKDIDSDYATAVRTIVVMMMSVVVVLVSGSYAAIGNVAPRSLVFLVLSGLATGGSWLCYFKAIQMGDVNKVVPIDKSSVVLTMVIAFLFLGESFGVFSFIGLVAIFAGTMLMIEKKDVPAGQKKHESWFIYAVLSAVFAALTSILAKIGISDVPSDLGTSIRTLVVLGMAWLIVLLRKPPKEKRNLSGRTGRFLVLSGLATGGSWLCFYGALQTGPASIIVPVDKLSILFTMMFAAFVLHERFSRRSLLGLAVLVVGTLALLV